MGVALSKFFSRDLFSKFDPSIIYPDICLLIASYLENYLDWNSFRCSCRHFYKILTFEIAWKTWGNLLSDDRFPKPKSFVEWNLFLSVYYRYMKAKSNEIYDILKKRPKLVAITEGHYVFEKDKKFLFCPKSDQKRFHFETKEKIKFITSSKYHCFFLFEDFNIIIAISDSAKETKVGKPMREKLVLNETSYGNFCYSDNKHYGFGSENEEEPIVSIYEVERYSSLYIDHKIMIYTKKKSDVCYKIKVMKEDKTNIELFTYHRNVEYCFVYKENIYLFALDKRNKSFNYVYVYDLNNFSFVKTIYIHEYCTPLRIFTHYLYYNCACDYRIIIMNLLTGEKKILYHRRYDWNLIDYFEPLSYYDSLLEPFKDLE